MAKLMVGNNFDEKLVDNMIEFNKKYQNSKVTEMYGSPNSIFPEYTARPLYRLPKKNIDEMHHIKSKLEANDILFNFTMNGPNIDKTKFDDEYFIRMLESLQIKRITVTSTFLLEILQRSGLDIEIELSTIYGIDSIYKMQKVLERYPKIKKVCMNLMRNRDMFFLEQWKKVFPDLITELMLNEFCLWQCPNRIYCYLNHQSVKTVEESKLFMNYPMRDCIDARNTDFGEWLKTRFILPQWIHYYKELGFEHFKITGRTSSTDFVTNVVKIYMDILDGIKNDYSFDELWYHLENIGKTRENEFTPNILKKIKYKHLEKYGKSIYEVFRSASMFDNLEVLKKYEERIEGFKKEIMEDINK